MKARTRRAKIEEMWFLVFLLVAILQGFDALGGQAIELHTRAAVETAKGRGEWRPVETSVQWEPKRTAIVVCDMWNQHWCKGATARVAEMAPRMNEVLKEARNHGVFIIHCPSDTMKFYEGTPQRKLAQAAPKIAEPDARQKWGGLEKSREGSLPI